MCKLYFTFYAYLDLKKDCSNELKTKVSNMSVDKASTKTLKDDECYDDIPVLPSPQSPPCAPPLLPLLQQGETKSSGLQSIKLKSKAQTPLLFKLTCAIESDSVEQLCALIRDGQVTVESTLSYGVPLLLKAVRSQSSQVIEYLLNQGANPVSAVDYLLMISLKPITYQSSINLDWRDKILLKLLSFCDLHQLNSCNSNDKNILLSSCYLSNLNIFEYLIDRGVEFHHQEFDIIMALLDQPDFSKSKLLPLIQQLFNHTNFNLKLNDYEYGFCLLTKSLVVDRFDLFQCFMLNGANPFARCSIGNTLMHKVCDFSYFYHRYTQPRRILPEFSALVIERIFFLYDLGLDVNATNNQGCRPLQDIPHTKFEILVLLFLGRVLTQSEKEEIKQGFGVSFSANIFESERKGKFSAFGLKNLCRKTIRKCLLLNKGSDEIQNSLLTLPLPQPLILYLDLKRYVATLLGCQNPWTDW